jgi:hypothetical protein
LCPITIEDIAGTAKRYSGIMETGDHGDRFLNETMKWISLQKPVPMIQKPVPMILLCASFAVNTAYGTGS